MVFLMSFLVAMASETWELKSSNITYTANHPFKVSIGKSVAAKGKGSCSGNQCSFLIAAPLKTFDSGDSNRDLHMLQVTRGGANPMVVVKTSLSSGFSASSPKVNYTITFAGHEVTYKEIPSQITLTKPNQIRVTTKLLVSLKDFSIVPPSLMTFEVEDLVPVDVDSEWIELGVST